MSNALHLVSTRQYEFCSHYQPHSNVFIDLAPPRWPPNWMIRVVVQVTTCRGGGILWRPHYRPHPHSLFTSKMMLKHWMLMITVLLNLLGLTFQIGADRMKIDAVNTYGTLLLVWKWVKLKHVHSTIALAGSAASMQWCDQDQFLRPRPQMPRPRPRPRPRLQKYKSYQHKNINEIILATFHLLYKSANVQCTHF